MYLKLISFAMLAISMVACNQHHHESDSHEEHEEAKFQYTVYSNDFELFAEADAFVAGESSHLLAHFSSLPDFRAIDDSKITLVFTMNGKETRQILDKPTRKGMYSFEIRPEAAGKGWLRFEIANSKGNFEVIVPDVTVFEDDTAAHEAAEKIDIPKTNTTVFTKEQSWKVDFASGYPKNKPFGQVIKTTALVEAAQGNELVVTARSAGAVFFSSGKLFEGTEINTGQTLFTISSDGLTDNNMAVKYAEARSNYEKAKADYDRASELVADRIIAEKDFLVTKNEYETTKAVFDNLNRSTGEHGQSITSPLTGFVRQVLVKNGTFVEAGQALVVVSQNKTLELKAEIPQRYASLAGKISTANIQNTNDRTTFSLEELNGRIVAFGKAANTDNFLLPVTIQIENRGQFIPGSFAEVYLKTITSTRALTVPATALLEEQGNYFVWVQVTPELFEKREVQIGATDGLEVEITDGISAQERIVTRGAMPIKLAQSTGALDAHSGHVH